MKNQIILILISELIDVFVIVFVGGVLMINWFVEIVEEIV